MYLIHGVSPDDPLSEDIWVTVYHAYPRGKAPGFSKGLDVSKSREGFFFARSPSEARRAIVGIQVPRVEDAELIRIRISKNVYDVDDPTGIIKRAASLGGDYYVIPTLRYEKVNKLMDEGYIIFGDEVPGFLR